MASSTPQNTHVSAERDLHPGERGIGDPGVRISSDVRPRWGVPGDRGIGDRGMWYFDEEVDGRVLGGVAGNVRWRRGVSGGVETIVGRGLRARSIGSRRGWVYSSHPGPMTFGSSRDRRGVGAGDNVRVGTDTESSSLPE